MTRNSYNAIHHFIYLRDLDKTSTDRPDESVRVKSDFASDYRLLSAVH